MYLLLFLIFFLVLGYLLSKTRISQSIDRSSENLSARTKEYAARRQNWPSTLFGRGRKITFINWVEHEGTHYLPQEFISWIISLNKAETKKFVRALADYMRGLGYDLKKLEDGSLDNKPALLQLYVEAVVIYSNAYRKAREAQKQAENSKEKTSSNGNQPKEGASSPVVEKPEMAEPVLAG